MSSETSAIRTQTPENYPKRNKLHLEHCESLKTRNITTDLREMGCGYMDWIGLAQDRQVADACECGNEPSGSVKCGEFLD